MPPVTIGRCLRDPNLFGPHFKGKLVAVEGLSGCFVWRGTGEAT